MLGETRYGYVYYVFYEAQEKVARKEQTYIDYCAITEKAIESTSKINKTIHFKG